MKTEQQLLDDVLKRVGVNATLLPVLHETKPPNSKAVYLVIVNMRDLVAVEKAEFDAVCKLLSPLTTLHPLATLGEVHTDTIRATIRGMKIVSALS